jgi:anhydro-N-acetylmuramic acid kinase
MTAGLSKENIMATLNKFTATIINDAIRNVTKDHKNCKLFISGGGIHNPLLMDHIKKELPWIFIDETMKKILTRMQRKRFYLQYLPMNV